MDGRRHGVRAGRRRRSADDAVDELMDSPVGRPVADHVYGGVPPLADSVRLVAVPTVPVWLPGLVTLSAVPPPPA